MYIYSRCWNVLADCVVFLDTEREARILQHAPAAQLHDYLGGLVDQKRLIGSWLHSAVQAERPSTKALLDRTDCAAVLLFFSYLMTVE